MSKRNIIIITLSIFILIVIIVAAVIVNLNNLDKSSITSDHYYVEKGLEKVAKVTKPAIESFATQDSTETAEARNTRLSQYFTKDSNVYSYSLNNLSPNTTKSKAKLTSVVSYGGEDDILIVSAIVYVDFYYNGKLSYSNSQTYLVSFNTSTNKSVSKPYDIEEQL